MILRLHPPLPLLTTKGKGLAHFLIDYGVEHDLVWVVFLDDNGECWSLRNPDIRGQKNLTFGRSQVQLSTLP